MLINVDSTIHDGREIVSSARAAKMLGVRKETLYAYASRGLLRRVALSGGGRRSAYLRSDVERLLLRSKARAGHAALAAGALRWGEPVLDSAITSIEAGGPAYRGHLAVELVAKGTPFESAAELLWTGALPREAPRWQPFDAGRASALIGDARGDVFSRFALVVGLLARKDPVRFGTPESDHARARGVIACLCRLDGRDGPSVARALERALPRRRRGAEAREALDAALVLIADHELNASSFAARVAASAGADVYACMVAALATASGPKHGGETERFEALVREVGTPSRAANVVAERAARGEVLPGLGGHPLYPHGDPRAPPLLERARAIGRRRSAIVTTIVDAAERSMGLTATVDAGLVALSLALEAPAGMAATLFAIGRSAGWVAHAIEQRQAGFLLRPRARYIGPGR